MTKRKEQHTQLPASKRGPMLPHMTEQSTNAGEIAVDLMFMAETMIEDGEDPEDVRAAFVAVFIRLKQLRDEADNDARQALAKAAGKVSTGTAQERWQGPLR